jgi:hypothetical protein
MQNYYQILRLQPEKDIQGKSENEIKIKIESHYLALVNRAPQMYKSMTIRGQMLKEIETARIILSDPIQRKIYDKQLKEMIEQQKSKEVSVTITLLTEENMAGLFTEEK